MNNNELNLAIKKFCNNCEDCSILFEMPYFHCCLRECYEHEFCKNCNKGIYSKAFKEKLKDWIKNHNE